MTDTTRLPNAVAAGTFTVGDNLKVNRLGFGSMQLTGRAAGGSVEDRPIATVQNLYNLTNRSSGDLLDHAARLGIGFIPWFPLATGALANQRSALSQIADRLGATPSQLALAWLLKRSPVMLPIPGTSSVAHLEERTSAPRILTSATPTSKPSLRQPA